MSITFCADGQKMIIFSSLKHMKHIFKFQAV